VTFNLSIPHTGGTPVSLDVALGESVFVLGANGTGKSGLMQRLYATHQDNARRISAHRQTWFGSNAITLSPEDRRVTENNILSMDTEPQARWRDELSGHRASIVIYDLINAQNIRNRSIAGAVDGGDMDLAEERSKKDAPIKIINELLRLSNIPIEISVRGNEQVVASKNGGTPYSVAELSDGERNALLIAADVLTVKKGTLILIDEPERHLHRSIISPLLTKLFARRPDCAFIVSTHEVMLPLDNPNARTLLLRGCNYSGSSATAWDADLVLPETEIDDELRKDILGARRKLLFVEGTEQSLDKSLYSLVFPDVSVIAKSSCRDVEHATSSIRDAANVHWIDAFGIVDNDRRTQADLDRLKEKGVYAISSFSVESIYYHPEIQRRVAERYAAVTGEKASQLLVDVKSAVLAAIDPHVQRLSERTAQNVIREKFFQNLPGKEEMASAKPIEVSIDVANEVEEERSRLQDALDNGRLEEVIAKYPIRETPALTKIAKNMGFQSREQYEGAVLKLLVDDKEALEFVKSLFGPLVADMSVVA
jgi:ABC-type branched-subunit amino acid transport system ATPase component